MAGSHRGIDAIAVAALGSTAALPHIAITGDNGVVNAVDTIVESTGTGYTFSHSNASGGVPHQLG